MARRPAAPGVDRRQQILEAALDVFAEQGFEGATTKEIATRADVTQGLIYFYFPSKEGLFKAAFEHYGQQAFTQLDFPADGEDDEPPEAVIRDVVGRLVETLDAPRTLCLMRIMLRMFSYDARPVRCGTPPDDDGRHRIRDHGLIRDHGRRIGAEFRRYLDAQVARGTLRPVDTALAAQFFVSGLMVTMMRRASGDESLAHLTRQELVDQMVGIFLKGLLVQPAPACAAQSSA
jgi:AcrR family transcriptional regulator